MKIKPKSEIAEKDKIRDYIIVTGKPRYGKSYLTRQKLVKEYNRVIILDRMGEYEGLIINDPEKLYNYLSAHKVFKICVTDLDHAKLEKILEIAWYFGNLTLVFEEANIWFPSKGVLSPIQADMLLRSRHRAISLIFVTQRYRRLHIDLRGAYEKMYIFRQTTYKDIEELENDTGEDLQEIANYPVGKFYFIG